MSWRVIYEFQHIPAVAVELPHAEAALGLRRVPWVDYVSPSTQELSADQSDPAGQGCDAFNYSQQTLPWNVTRIRADQAWSQWTGTNGALLVVDDGLNVSQNTYYGTLELSWSTAIGFSGQQPDGPGDGAHGTLTQSVATARNNSMGIVGVAHGADAHYGDLMPNGVALTWQNAAAAIIDAAAPNVRVVSISYSSKETGLPAGFAALYDAIRNAYHERNIIIVASTGNQENATIQSYPARWAEVIGVGGAGYDDEYVFNNYAAGNVEVAAPAVGVGVICAGAATQGTANGTSFATPAVAGAVMLLRQAFPTWSNDAIRQRLRDTAVPMADPQRSGAGRIDVYAALPFTPPLAAYVSGPSVITRKGTYAWTANPSGGVGGYAYQWSVYYPGWGQTYQLGTGQSQQLTVYAGDGTFEMRVVVRSGSATETATMTVVECISGGNCYQ